MSGRALVVGLVAVALHGCGPQTNGPLMLPFVIDDANSEHKPLVIEFNATWCGPCRVFARRVLTDSRVQSALAAFKFVQYDVDTPAGRDAQRRCRLHQVPSVVGIDHEGTIRVQKIGTEPTADQFLEFLREAKVRLGVSNSRTVETSLALTERDQRPQPQLRHPTGCDATDSSRSRWRCRSRARSTVRVALPDELE